MERGTNRVASRAGDKNRKTATKSNTNMATSMLNLSNNVVRHEQPGAHTIRNFTVFTKVAFLRLLNYQMLLYTTLF